MDVGSSHCTGGSDQDHPQEKEMQKGKMVEKALQIAEKEVKLKAEEKSKNIPIWMQNFKEYHGRIRKPSSVNNAKK